MRALVTGGAGFVGTNLIIRLLESGYIVTSFDNYSTGCEENKQDGCDYLEIDISREFSLNRRFDVIFHLAALPRIGPSFKNPIDVFKSNVNGTINILDYARKHEVPVVYAGTSSFWGGVYKNPYTFSKWQGEELCKMYERIYDLPVTICRFYNVYGDYMQNEGEYRTVLSIFLEQYRYGKSLTITGDGEQRRDFTNVLDVVEANVLAATKDLDDSAFGQVYNVGTGINHSINEIAEMISDNTEYIPPRLGEARVTLAHISRIKGTLGWEPKIKLEDWIESALPKEEVEEPKNPIRESFNKLKSWIYGAVE